MTNCLQAGYNITRQPAIAIFFLYLWCARLFFVFFSPSVGDYYIFSLSGCTFNTDGAFFLFSGFLKGEDNKTLQFVMKILLMALCKYHIIFILSSDPQITGSVALFVWLISWRPFQQLGSIAGESQDWHLTILLAATHKTERGDHDFYLSRSHYTDTDPTSRERAATAGIGPRGQDLFTRSSALYRLSYRRRRRIRTTTTRRRKE